MINLTKTIKIFIFFIPIVFFINSTTSFAQPLVWNRNYGGSGMDYPGETIKCSEPGYISVVSSNSTNGEKSVSKGEFDIWVIRLDTNGGIAWEKSFGSPNNDYACNIIETSDFGYVITGRIFGHGGDINTSFGDDDIWIAKIDAAGNLIWETTIGGPGKDICRKIIQTSDTGYLLCGWTTSSSGMITGNHGGGDGLIAKLDKDGNVKWIKCLGGSHVDGLYSVLENDDGDFILMGNTSSVDGDLAGRIYPQGDTDAWITKIESDGTLVWGKTYGGSYIDILYSGLLMSNENIVVCGASQSNDRDLSSNNGGYDFWVFEIDKSGTLISGKSFNYGGSKNDEAKNIITTHSGGYMVIGTTKSPDSTIFNNHIGFSNTYDIWLVKIDSTGKEINNRAFGSNGDDGAGVCILSNTDSSFVIASSSDYVSGDVVKNVGEKDFWIFKIGKWLSINSLKAVGSQDINIYPTLTNGDIYISSPRIVSKVEVINIIGKVVLKEQLQQKNHMVDISPFKSGVYLVRVYSNNILLTTQKVVKY